MKWKEIQTTSITNRFPLPKFRTQNLVVAVPTQGKLYNFTYGISALIKLNFFSFNKIRYICYLY